MMAFIYLFFFLMTGCLFFRYELRNFQLKYFTSSHDLLPYFSRLLIFLSQLDLVVERVSPSLDCLEFYTYVVLRA